MAMLRILMSIAAAAMLMQSALAVDYTVGAPNGGWDTSTDLGSWASALTFRVGDNIVFRYTATHDVLEVNEADYNSCQPTTPLLTDVNSPTTVPLTATGSRFFICGRSNHCDQGMKVRINTVAGPPSTTTPSGPAPPRTTTPAAPGPDGRAPLSPPGQTVNPPSSAITVKTTSASIIGFGLVMMLLSF